MKVKMRQTCSAHCGKWQQMPANAGDKGRQVAANLHEPLRQIATNLLSQFAAFCCASRLALFPTGLGKGWCLSKLSAFTFQKAARPTKGTRMYNRKRRGIGKGFLVHESNADFFDATHVIGWIPGDGWKFDGKGPKPGGYI